MTVPAESIIRAEEENIVRTVLTIIIFLKVPAKYIQRMFIAEWKMAGSTTALRGVVFHSLHTPK